MHLYISIDLPKSINRGRENPIFGSTLFEKDVSWNQPSEGDYSSRSIMVIAE